MQRLRSEDGVTFLFIEHDMEVVMNHSDRVIVMAEGAVIADGEPHEVRSDKAVIDAYLGGGGEREPGRHERRTAERRGRPAHRGRDRRLRARGRHPQRRLDRRPRGRDRHHRRAQRGGQVDPDQDDLRPPASARRAGSSSGARRSPGASRTTSPASGSPTCRSSTTSSRASRSRRTSRWARSTARATAAQIDRMYELFPRLRRARDAGRGDDERRRAPDGGDGARR